ncbi:arsenate reductase (glutaredoxin) [Hwanghaeella sp.]|uniref:arsenate reductase (glutaredoxin) n=1 Tax=Hwanghaeella sp. TaxID=2605943 RepID=UPI003CCC248E
MTVTIYHNPRCSKSRQTLALLQDKGIEPEIVEYLKTPPSADEIAAILKKLGIEARSLMRTKEAVYKELGLDAVTDEKALIAAMAENPVLIERPVVIKGSKAALGRPPEQVLEIL